MYAAPQRQQNSNVCVWPNTTCMTFRIIKNTSRYITAALLPPNTTSAGCRDILLNACLDVWASGSSPAAHVGDAAELACMELCSLNHVGGMMIKLRSVFSAVFAIHGGPLHLAKSGADPEFRCGGKVMVWRDT